MGPSLSILLLCSVAGASYARTNAEVKKWFIQQAVECSKEHPVTGEELQQIKMYHKLPDSKSAKCLAACMFKRIEWMDEKGKFEVENAMKMSEKDFSADKTRLENSKKLYELCSKVNDETVPSNEDQVCGRANLLAVCLTENASKFGFVLQ